MQVRYVDEYGVDLFNPTDNPFKDFFPPSVGDTVVIEEDEYRVKSRTFHPYHNVVVIEMTQNLVRSKSSNDEEDGRLKEMQRAIVEVNKRQDQHEKTSRILREQLVSVRQYIRRNNRPKETT